MDGHGRAEESMICLQKSNGSIAGLGPTCHGAAAQVCRGVCMLQRSSTWTPWTAQRATCGCRARPGEEAEKGGGGHVATAGLAKASWVCWVVNTEGNTASKRAEEMKKGAGTVARAADGRARPCTPDTSPQKTLQIFAGARASTRCDIVLRVEHSPPRCVAVARLFCLATVCRKTHGNGDIPKGDGLR